METHAMKKLIAGLALVAVALTNSLAVAAAPAATLDRAASPVSGSEELAGAGIWAVLAVIAVGVGAILLIEEEEDDLPESP